MNRRISAGLVLGLLISWEPLCAEDPSAWGASSSHQRQTYCNPLPLPSYPLGRYARDLKGADTGPEWMWRLGSKQPFRELADVSALWHEGRWYLYPSVDMAWVSEDLGATWRHHPLNVRDLGYAPTIVKHKDRFLLMASNSPIFISESPLGPFEELGRIRLERSSAMPDFIDPMLFSDTDGRLFYYWGCSPRGGIWGVELDADDPTTTIGNPMELIPFDPKQFPWEAVGAWNQNPRVGWMEGAWMLKRDGRYYLTYSAGGTENRTYAMGAYVSDSPMGPFVPQKRNPILRTIDGLITGTAHGSIVVGPDDTLWAFYTVRASVVHAFERRLGMDRAGVDPNGELYVHPATSIPQRLPNATGMRTTHAVGNDRASDDRTRDYIAGDYSTGDYSAGWLPLNGDLRTLGSSHAPNLEGRFAVDNDICTWWEASPEDAGPTLTTEFLMPSTVHAVRILWRDIAKDIISREPVRYRVELQTGKDQWVTIVDRQRNDEDLLIDYCECAPTLGTRARLVIVPLSTGNAPGVAEFTLFGITN